MLGVRLRKVASNYDYDSDRVDDWRLIVVFLVEEAQPCTAGLHRPGMNWSVLITEKHGGPVCVATAHSVADGIKHHKLVLVVRNQVDRLRRQMTKLGYFIIAKLGGAITVTDHVDAFPNDVSKVLAAYPVSVRISHAIGSHSLVDWKGVRVQPFYEGRSSYLTSITT
jgi:hypothetical protein